MLEKLPDAIGHALRDVRAGLDNTAFNQSGLRSGLAAIEVGSLAFADHAPMPVRYTADGAGLSPPIHWRGVPAGTASLVVIVEDADAPTPRPLVNAIVVDLPGDADGALPEGALASPDHDSDAVHAGRNSFLAAARPWPAPLCVSGVCIGPGGGRRRLWRHAGPRRSDGSRAQPRPSDWLRSGHLRAA